MKRARPRSARAAQVLLPATRIARTGVAGFLLLAGCLGPSEGPYSGTATTTGNTITGIIVPETGDPIPVSVALYSEGHQPGFAGAASSPLPEAIRVETRTGADGRFAITVPAGRDYMLVASSGGETARVLWEKGIRPLPGEDTTRLDTLVIRPAAALRGRIGSADAGDAAGDSTVLWAGFIGTGAFSRVDGNGEFRLEELPAGPRALAILRDRRRAQGWARETFLVEGIDLQEGRSHVLDSLALEDNRPVTDTLRAAACLEDPVVLRPAPEGAARPPAVGKDVRFRTFSLAEPHALLELDPCRGTWSPVASLAARPRLLFSDTGADLVVLEGRRTLLRIDPRTGAQETLPMAFDALCPGYFGGRYYALVEADTLLRIYPDRAAFLADRPSGQVPWPFPFTPDRYDISAVEGGIHYVVETDRLELYYMDLRDPASPQASPAKILEGFAGAYRGFSGGYDGTVWVLNDAHELFQFPVAGGAWIRRVRIDGAPVLRGLTQFP